MIKVLERAGIQGTYLNIIKAIYIKPTANIKLNGEKLTMIPLKSETLSISIQCSTKVQARAIIQQKEINGI